MGDGFGCCGRLIYLQLCLLEKLFAGHRGRIHRDAPQGSPVYFLFYNQLPAPPVEDGAQVFQENHRYTKQNQKPIQEKW